MNRSYICLPLTLLISYHIGTNTPAGTSGDRCEDYFVSPLRELYYRDQSDYYCNYDLYNQDTGVGEIFCTYRYLQCNYDTFVCSTRSSTTTYDYVDRQYTTCHELEGGLYGYGVPYSDHTYCFTVNNYEGGGAACEISVYETVCNSCSFDYYNYDCADFDCKSRTSCCPLWGHALFSFFFVLFLFGDILLHAADVSILWYDTVQTIPSHL